MSQGINNKCLTLYMAHLKLLRRLKPPNMVEYKVHNLVTNALVVALIVKICSKPPSKISQLVGRQIT